MAKATKEGDKRRTVKTPIIKECALCGEEFPTTGAKRLNKYCSPECESAGMSINVKERMKKRTRIGMSFYNI